MKLATRKETERMLLSLLIAVVIHTLIFLIIEYADFLTIEKPAEYVGPMVVELSEVTIVPEPVKPVEEETKPEEEPFKEEPEAPPREPLPAEEVTPEEKTVPETVDREGPSDIAPTPREETKPQPLPEAKPETPSGVATPPVPTPLEAKEHIYNGKDQSNEFMIKWGSIGTAPKLIWEISVAQDLPDWVRGIEKPLEITFSFIIGPNGRISHINLDKSSGYPDIDRIVANNLMEAKFSIPVQRERVDGTFTYRIKP